jgi:hypothetical protein
MKTTLSMLLIVLMLTMAVPAFAYKHHSQAQGALIGAAAGALIGHHSPVKGALIGAAVGTGVQMVRNKHEQKHAHHRRHHHRH